MTQSAIIAKLEKLLGKGIASEAEALYLMVAVRRVLVRQQAKKQGPIPHVSLRLGSTCKVGRGDSAENSADCSTRPVFTSKKGVELHDLPDLLRTDIILIRR